MKLSVIIVSYNTKKLTLQAIGSVLAEKRTLTLEVIVVDNNSTDGSVDLLMDLEAKSKIALIKNDRNLGFSKANNQAIKIAKGEYILLLNSDTVVEKAALKKLITFSEETHDAGVVSPRLLNSDGSVQASCRYFPTLGRAVSEYWFGKKGFFESFAPKSETPVTVDSVIGAAFLITPKALKKVGALDERYFFYYEDIDYCRRVWQSGLKVYYYPGAEIIHLVGASGKELAGKENQWRRLIPSSKTYHGVLGYYILYAVMLLGQKWQKLLQKLH